VGVEAALARVVEHLAARGERRVDADEPTGLLTHHLAFDDAAWRFADDLVAATRAAGGEWLDARAIFGPAPADATVTRAISARSA
jgi:hypothetical protein